MACAASEARTGWATRAGDLEDGACRAVAFLCARLGHLGAFMVGSTSGGASGHRVSGQRGCGVARGRVPSGGRGGVGEEKPVVVPLLSACGLSAYQQWGRRQSTVVRCRRWRERQSRPHTAGEAANDWAGDSVLHLILLVGAELLLGCGAPAAMANRRQRRGRRWQDRHWRGRRGAEGGPVPGACVEGAATVGRERSSRHGRESCRRTVATGAGERATGIGEKGSWQASPRERERAEADGGPRRFTGNQLSGGAGQVCRSGPLRKKEIEFGI
jgi:hypothetical protein